MEGSGGGSSPARSTGAAAGPRRSGRRCGRRGDAAGRGPPGGDDLAVRARRPTPGRRMPRPPAAAVDLQLHVALPSATAGCGRPCTTRTAAVDHERDFEHRATRRSADAADVYTSRSTPGRWRAIIYALRALAVSPGAASGGRSPPGRRRGGGTSCRRRWRRRAGCRPCGTAPSSGGTSSARSRCVR